MSVKTAANKIERTKNNDDQGIFPGFVSLKVLPVVRSY